MKSIAKSLALLLFFVLRSRTELRTLTISGTVKDPAGGAVSWGICACPRIWKSKITAVNVLSNNQGHYQIQDLPPGEYDVRATAVGFKADPRSDVKLTEGEATPIDFALQQGTVRWSDLSVYQGMALLPEAEE